MVVRLIGSSLFFVIQVGMDRSNYHYRIAKAIHFKDCWSWIADGSDNSRYGLPYVHVVDKETAEGWKLQTRLYGVIVHGICSCAYTFPAYMTGGSNCMIEVLHR